MYKRQAVKGFPKVFGILDEAVKSGFYGSDSFSMADCFLLPILNSVQRYPEGKDAVESAANVSAYFNAHSERSSFVETTP